jgi:hypothetical protein
VTVSAANDVYFDPYDVELNAEWDVDSAEYQLSPTSTVRGWETMPANVG